MKKPGRRSRAFALSCRRALAKHAAHYAADEAAGAGGIRAMISGRTVNGGLLTAATTATAGTTARLLLVVAGACGRRGRHDLGQQRLVLQLVEIAAGRVAARRLP